jgi:hypothetical protein
VGDINGGVSWSMDRVVGHASNLGPFVGDG